MRPPSAVDGIAVKAMVNAWAAAPEGQKEIIFQAAIGLVSGATVTIYGVAQLSGTRFPKWLGLLGLAARKTY
jgi:hypothetical protein